MSASTKILKRLFSIPLVAIISLGPVAPAAQANTAVLLPDGADGVAEDNDLLAYACPGILEVFAPAPARVGGLSKFESAQIGQFNWKLLSNGTVDGQADGSQLARAAYGNTVWNFGLAFMSQMSYEPRTAFAVGSSLPLSLEGSISTNGTNSSGYTDGGVLETYTPTAFDFSVTVVDPAFADGSGTQADPYMVSDQADLAKLRCYKDAYFELANDIALSGKWLPIGGSPGGESSWRGHLDGAGFKITGLDIGHDSMSQAGLFGRVANSSFSNLTIESPVVKGSSYVGTLFALTDEDWNLSDDRVDISNVHITNATVSGVDTVGIMAGEFLMGFDADNDYTAEGEIKNSSVSGNVNLNPVIFRDPGTGTMKVLVETVSGIGGMFGNSGDGADHFNNSVTVNISQAAEHNYSALIAELKNTIPTLAIDNLVQMNNWVGGYAGGAWQGRFRNINVTAKIYLEALADVQSIGGFSGTHGGQLENTGVSSDIDIIVVEELDENNRLFVTDVGGVNGDDSGSERSSAFVNSSANILIAAGTSTNNTLGLQNQTPEYRVARVGGYFGSSSGSFSTDLAIRVHADISTDGTNRTRYVAGYIGEFENSVSYSHVVDAVVTGSISVQNATTVDKIAGFTNWASGQLLAARNVAAVSLNVPDGTTLSGPFAGEMVNAGAALDLGNYWNSTVNTLENPAGYPGTAATTAQLQDASFLAKAYFDLNNLWQLNGGYPELRTGLYGNKTLSATGSPTIIPAPPQTPAPAPSPAPAPYIGPVNISVQPVAEPGGTAIATGQRLNTVSGVSVNGEAVNYTVKTDGSLHFEIPELANGKYRVLFSAASGGALSSEIEVLAPQPEPEPEPAPTPQSVGKVNVGSFNGKLVVYAQGLDGARISWRIAGRWQVVTAEGDELNRFDRPVGQAGRNVKVEIFVDGERRLEKTVLTR